MLYCLSDSGWLDLVLEALLLVYFILNGQKSCESHVISLDVSFPSKIVFHNSLRGCKCFGIFLLDKSLVIYLYIAVGAYN